MRSPRLRVAFYAMGVGLCLFLAFEKRILPGSPQRPSHQGFELLGTVANLIKNDYLEERDPVRTMEGAYKGLIDSLDPVSSYLSKETTAKHLNKTRAWAETGITLYKKTHNSFPQVVGVVEGSPAEKAGIRYGDVISAMDGTGTLGMSSLEANLFLRSLEIRPIAVKVLRETETLDVSVNRAVLRAQPSSLSSEGTFSVIAFRDLNPPCVQKIKKEILSRLRTGKVPLVLDLRNCSEGEMEEARSLLNVFYQSPGLGTFEKKGGIKESLSCPAKPDLPFLPGAIWVNQATMGPAELVAAVLQNTRKVKVIGLETPGLVSRQDLHPLQDGSSILLTSGVFTLASGKTLWGEGVVPDEKIDFDQQDSGTFKAKTAALLSGR